MTIWTDSPTRRGPFYLEDYQASLGASVDAATEGAFVTDPVPSLLRSGELTAAEQGPLSTASNLALGAIGTIAPPVALWRMAQAPGLPSIFRSAPNSPIVDAATARQQIKDEGLNLTVPDTGIRSAALKILIDRKKEERQRNDILNRAPGGLVAGATRLGTNLAVSALDPLNIASAFIPVVGEARYAAMLERASGAFGRAGVRVGVGAAEGAVGAAVVEPIVAGAAHQEQADYTLSDSIANIAFGTVLGGGLHVGAGAISDAIKAGRDWRTARAAPDAPIPRMMESVDAGTREAALRTGIAQAVTGREINIEPVVSYASRQGFEEPLRASVGPAETPRVDEVTGVEGFTVFHGSPHQFERFDIGKIGTGEGNQVYGRGLYLAQARSVGEEYAKDVIDKPYFDQVNTQLSALAKEMDKYRSGSKFNDPRGHELKAEYDKLLDERAAKKGNLYEVHIRANPEDFLDWDKPLSEQSPKIRAAISAFSQHSPLLNVGRKALWRDILRDNVQKDAVGGEIYKAMANTIAPPKDAKTTKGKVSISALLAKEGIPGIKYLDAGSRTAGDGSRNFVVFDDSLLHTVRRNDEFIAKQPQDLRATAQASFNPEQMRLYDGEAVRIADERIASAPTDEAMPELSLKEAMEDVTRLANAVGDPEIVGREMAEVNALVDTAEAYGRGVVAAADCRLRRS